MRNYSIDELANKVAKDVLVAIAPNLSISIDEKGGKQVAEFYLHYSTVLPTPSVILIWMLRILNGNKFS